MSPFNEQNTTLTLHGTCVDIKGSGVLIQGKPGAGKSSLALQLIDRGAILVADDQTILTLVAEDIVAQSPVPLKGLLEVRDVGICSFPYTQTSPLKLCVEIGQEITERLPEPQFVEYHNVISLLKLQQNDPLGMLKVELKLSHKGEDDGS